MQATWISLASTIKRTKIRGEFKLDEDILVFWKLMFRNC